MVGRSPARSKPAHMRAGATEAWDRLEGFVEKDLGTYADNRDHPALAGTSVLSPYLRFGCIHPRTVLEQLGAGSGAARLRDELAWREFYADVLWHRPESARRPLQAFGEELRCGPRREGPRPVPGLGHRDGPVTASSTPGCVNCSPRDGCTTVRGWSRPSFLVKDLHIDWRLGSPLVHVAPRRR